MQQSDCKTKLEAVIRAIKKYNQRGKQIKFYACYQGEQYSVHRFLDYDDKAFQPINSITKAITCSVVLQLAQCHDIALEQPLLKDLPYDPPNQAAKQLSIAQFVNMTTGIEWREIDGCQQADCSFEQFVQSAAPLDYLFSRKIVKDSGFNYNSAASHALTYWAEAISGQSFERLVADMIFKPLGIVDYRWQRDATGRVFGGHGLALKGADFIKLMPLFATGGYAKKQVLDQAVLKRFHQLAVKATLGYRGYGYGLWHGKIKNAPFIGAFGSAGQRIYYFVTLKQSHAFLGNTKPEFGIQEAILKNIL